MIKSASNTRDVGVTVTLNQIHSINVIDQSFFVDIKLMVVWKDAAAAKLSDPDAAAAAAGKNGAIDQQSIKPGAAKALWVPKIFLLNGEHSNLIPNSYISDADKGRPRTQFVYAGTCFCPCDLHDFPFDSQRLLVR